MADHGRSILTVLTDCSAGAATHVAEESDAGEAVSTTKVASVYGLWSTALDALLSPYPLVFCCVHQLLFPCLEVLIHGTSPPRAVSCKAHPASMSNAFMSLMQTSLYCSRGRPVVLFPDASSPYRMSFGMRPCGGHDLASVVCTARAEYTYWEGQHDFLGYAHDTANTSQVEGVESSLLSCITCPCLAAILPFRSSCPSLCPGWLSVIVEPRYVKCCTASIS